MWWWYDMYKAMDISYLKDDKYDNRVIILMDAEINEGFHEIGRHYLR